MKHTAGIRHFWKKPESMPDSLRIFPEGIFAEKLCWRILFTGELEISMPVKNRQYK